MQNKECNRHKNNCNKDSQITESGEMRQDDSRQENGDQTDFPK
jgi:hypothetical protein